MGDVFCSADLEDLWHRSKLVLLPVLVAGRLEKTVGEVSGLLFWGTKEIVMKSVLCFSDTVSVACYELRYLSCFLFWSMLKNLQFMTSPQIWIGSKHPTLLDLCCGNLKVESVNLWRLFLCHCSCEVIFYHVFLIANA